jgi:hypothetical protein
MVEPTDKTATEEVADDDLAAAWDVATGEEKKAGAAETSSEPVKKEGEDATKIAAAAETPASTQADNISAPVETPDQLAEHKESSKLGRQVKGLKSRLEQVEARLSQKVEVSEEMPEIITTPDDVIKVMKGNKQEETIQAQRKQDIYERDYIKQLNALESYNSGLHDEIVALMTEKNSPYGEKLGDNGFADARINYAEAKAFLVEKKHTTNRQGELPIRTLASIPPVVPAAGASSSATKVATLPKLDPEAQAYVNYLIAEGKTETEIAEMLK